MLILLRTTGGDQYWIVGNGRGHSLYVQNGPRITRPTLAKILFILGGMVPWDVWTDDARTVLKALNHGQAI